MDRKEAEHVVEEMGAITTAEQFLELIEEWDCDGSEASALEALANVMQSAQQDDELSGDLYDAIEAIAMEALDKLRAAAKDACATAAKEIGFEYQPPADDQAPAAGELHTAEGTGFASEAVDAAASGEVQLGEPGGPPAQPALPAETVAA